MVCQPNNLYTSCFRPKLGQLKNYFKKINTRCAQFKNEFHFQSLFLNGICI